MILKYCDIALEKISAVLLLIHMQNMKVEEFKRDGLNNKYQQLEKKKVEKEGKDCISRSGTSK